MSDSDDPFRLEAPTLERLPRGSRCVEYKTVPSRSSYHNSDEIERCARFDTKGGPTPPDRGDGDSDDDSDDSDGPPDVPETIGVWELRSRESDQITWEWDRKKMDGGTVLVSVHESDETGMWGASVGNIDKLESETITTPDVPKERALSDAIEFMRQESNGYDPSVPDDTPEEPLTQVGAFDLVEWEPKKPAAEYVAVGEWSPGYPASLNREAVTVAVRIRGHGGRFEHKVSSDVSYWQGERDGAADEETRITTQRDRENPRRAFDNALAAAYEWMDENPPDGVPDDEPTDDGTTEWNGNALPDEYHGYTLEEAGDEMVEYVGWNPSLTRSNPTRHKRVVRLTSKVARSSGWHLRYGEVDTNGNGSATNDPSDNDEWNDIQAHFATAEVMDDENYVNDHLKRLMDEYEAGKRDFDYAFRIDAEGENRTVLEHTKNMARFGNWGPLTLAVGDNTLSFDGTSINNHVGYYSDTHLSAFPNLSPSNVTDGAADVPLSTLHDYVNEGTKTSDIRLTVTDSPEENVPPYLEVEVDGEEQTSGLKRVWLTPPSHVLRDQFNDIYVNTETSITDVQASEFKRLVKGANVIVPSDESMKLIAQGDDGVEAAQLRVSGDVDEFVGQFDAPDVDGPQHAVAVNAGYMSDIAVIPRPKTTEIDLHLKCDHPLFMFYDLRGKVDGDMKVIGKTRYMVAPRIVDSGMCNETFDVTESGMLAEEIEETRPTPRPRDNVLHSPDRADDPLSAYAEPPHPFMGLESPATVKTSDGEPFDLQIEGDAVVYTFPKTLGCRCSTQALQFQELKEQIGMDVYGVATADPDHLADFKETFKLDYTLVSDPSGALAEQLGVPTNDDGLLERVTIFYKGGEEVERVEGMTDISVRSDDTAAATLNQPSTLHPFAGYDDHGDCVRKNQDKNDPDAYCWAIKNRIEEMEWADQPEIARVTDHPSTYVVTGKRGSGKSSLAYTLGEHIAKRHNIRPVTVGVPKTAESSLPDYWYNVDTIEEAPCNCVVVVDEAYRKFNARRPMSQENVDLSQLVNLSRQNDQTILFVSQSTSQLDKNSILEADGVFMKEPGPFHQRFERRGVRDLTENAKERFEQLPESHDRRTYTYVYTDDEQGMYETPEVGFYDDNLSHTFATTCAQPTRDDADTAAFDCLD